MIHLFILFPLLVILSVSMVWFYRKHPDNVSLYYFRNFFAVWSVCTVAIGAAETFWHTPYAKSMALSLAVPFLYVASAFLIKLPFALYMRRVSVANSLAALVIIAGIFFGATSFVSANKLIGSLGPLNGIFKHLAANLATYRIWSTLIIFIPVGLFFLVEAIRSAGLTNRIRSGLVGVGLVTAGVSEYFHISAKHAAGADFYTVLGFFLVVGGLYYGFLKSPAPADIV